MAAQSLKTTPGLRPRHALQLTALRPPWPSIPFCVGPFGEVDLVFRTLPHADPQYQLPSGQTGSVHCVQCAGTAVMSGSKPGGRFVDHARRLATISTMSGLASVVNATVAGHKRGRWSPLVNWNRRPKRGRIDHRGVPVVRDDARASQVMPPSMLRERQLGAGWPSSLTLTSPPGHSAADTKRRRWRCTDDFDVPACCPSRVRGEISPGSMPNASIASPNSRRDGVATEPLLRGRG